MRARHTKPHLPHYRTRRESSHTPHIFRCHCSIAWLREMLQELSALQFSSFRLTVLPLPSVGFFLRIPSNPFWAAYILILSCDNEGIGFLDCVEMVRLALPSRSINAHPVCRLAHFASFCFGGHAPRQSGKQTPKSGASGTGT